jgi:uncharacterized protein (TIGR02147 family)
MESIFAHNEYKALIRASLIENKKIRGYQAQLAQAAGCGASFLSQALNTHVHISADQAAGLASFWNFSPDQTEYFLSLVHLARTSSPAYTAYLNKRLQDLRDKHSKISERVKSEQVNTQAEELVYYSAWFWSAIHVITSIPRYQSTAAIAQRLALPSEQVLHCLNILQNAGMVMRKGDRWQAQNKSYHLERESPLIGIHHTNWRQRALANAIQNTKSDSLHYSVVHSLSVDDFEKIKTMLLDFVEKSKKIVEASPEQELIAVCFDCFKV